MKAILIDLDGVIYQGDEPVPGAVEAVTWLDKKRIPYLFVTNTTSRPRDKILEKLAGYGITTDEEKILTPVVTASRWIRDHVSGPSALFVPEATKRDLQDIQKLPGEEERGAAAVVLGDLGEKWTYPTLNRAFRLLMDEASNPVLIALGMTRYWRAPDGLRLDVAPFVKALEHATGREAVVVGKPSPTFFQQALTTLDSKAKDTVMIGDDIVADVRGAQTADLGGVLVKTGKFRAADLAGTITPDAVLDSIASLPGWWEENN
jgi:phospholysine phosphohistidine inorganic pyrophosphate phosphatase